MFAIMWKMLVLVYYEILWTSAPAAGTFFSECLCEEQFSTLTNTIRGSAKR